MIHHFGAHFSRCVKAEELQEFTRTTHQVALSDTSPFLGNDRETRSKALSPGLMVCKNFDPAMLPLTQNRETYQPVQSVPGGESPKLTPQPLNPQNQSDIKPYTEKLWMKERLEEITEIDVVFEAQKELKRLVQYYSIEITASFTEHLMNLILIIEPAQAMLVNQSEAKSKVKKAIGWRLTPESSLFSKIRKVLKYIEILKGRVALVEQKLRDENGLKELKEVLKNLSRYYQQFIGKCCQANQAEFGQLKAFKPYISSSLVGQRYLNKEAAKELLAAISSNIPEGQSHVVVQYAGIHFKGSPEVMPEAPGTEFMVHSMANILFGRGTPPTELLKIVYSNQTAGNTAYPLMASKTKEGVNLTEFEQRETLKALHPTGYAESFFLGIFTNPNDGKPENFIVDKCGWIWGIDMDMSEVWPYMKVPVDSKPDRYYTNIFYYPFLFPQMDHRIDPVAKQSFLSSHPALNMIIWLESLLDQNAKYKHLQNSGVLFPQELEGMHLPIQIFEGLVQVKYQKMLTAWQALTNDREGILTYRELFKLVDPILAKYYEAIQKKHLTALEGYQNVHAFQGLLRMSAQEKDKLCWIDNILDLDELVDENRSIGDYLKKHALSPKEEQDPMKQKGVIDELETFISTIDCRSLGAYEDAFLTEIGKAKELRTLSIKNSTIRDRKLMELVDSLPALTHIELDQCPNIPGLCLMTIAKQNPKLKFHVRECAQVNEHELGVIAPLSLKPFKQEACEEVVDNLPPKNPLFTGRQAQLTYIENRFVHSQGPVVLSGMGGVGKSHLALEFAHRNRKKYGLVWWVHTEKKEVCLDTILLLGKELEKITKNPLLGPDRDQNVRKTLEALTKNKDLRWLIVFDNAEKSPWLDDIVRGLESEEGHILLTSREKSLLQGYGEELATDVFDPVESIACLKKIAGPSHSDIKLQELASELGHLPLALTQAGRCICNGKASLSITEYLENFKKAPIEMMELGQDFSEDQKLHVASVARTWDVSLRHFELSPVAMSILNVIPFLDPDTLSLTLFSTYLKNKSEHLVKELESRSIIRLTAPNQYSIHRLLQLVIKNRLSPQERHHTAAQLIKTLHEELKRVVQEERWELSYLWLPHVPFVVSELESTDMTSQEKATFIELFLFSGKCLAMQGNLDVARETVVKAVSLGRDFAMPELSQNSVSVAEEKILAAVALKEETPELALLHQALRSLAEIYAMQACIAKIQYKEDDSRKLGNKAHQILQHYPDYRWNPYVNFCRNKLKMAPLTLRQAQLGFVSFFTLSFFVSSPEAIQALIEHIEIICNTPTITEVRIIMPPASLPPELMHAIENTLVKAPHIQKVQLLCFPHHFVAIAQAFKKNQNIREFEVMPQGPMSETQERELIQILNSIGSLERLSLPHSLQPTSWGTFADTFNQVNSIKSLKIGLSSYISIPLNVLRNLAERLKEKSDLECLQLPRIHLPQSVPIPVIVNLYADLILSSPKLQELSLNFVGEKEAIEQFLNLFLPRIIRSPTLLHLKLKLDDAFMKSKAAGPMRFSVQGIEDFIRENRTLVSFELKNCPFSDQDALIRLGNAIHMHPTLEEVKLENVIGLDIETFFQCFKDNGSLKHLTLPGSIHQVNQVSIGQFEQIISILKTTSINGISFENWGLGDKHANALLDFIETHSELVQLSIAHNHFTGNTLTQILVSLLNHPNLEEAGVKRNNIKNVDERLLIAFNDHFSKLKDNTHDASWYEDPFFSCNFIAMESFMEFASNALYQATTAVKQNVDLSNANLNDKRLTKIIESIRENSYLISLDLSNNAIGDEGIKALTPIIQNSPTLEELNLSKNEITSAGFHLLFQAIGPRSNIRKLILSDNDIKKISPAIDFHASTLQVLELSNCQLECSKSNGLGIVKMINQMQNLRELDLSRNVLVTESIILRDILNSLKLNSHITNLDCTPVKLDASLIRLLSECLLFNFSLSKIKIQFDSVSINDFRRLIWARKYNKRSVMFQEFSDESSVFSIVPALEKRRFQEKVVYEERWMLREKRVKSRTLRSEVYSGACLNAHYGNNAKECVRNGRIGSLCESNTKALKEYLAIFREVKDKQPEGYHFSQTSFFLLFKTEVKQVEELCHVLKNYPGFPSVAFFHNKIGSRTSCISEFLNGNESIRTLDLMWEEIPDEGAITIAEGLSHNKKLEELDLSYNAIGPQGVIALLRCALKHPTLKKLELHWNHVNDDCIPEIMEIIRDKECSVEYIGLAFNQLSQHSIEQLEWATEFYGKEITIELFGNADPYITETEKVIQRKKEKQHEYDLQLGQLMLNQGDGVQAFKYFNAAQIEARRGKRPVSAETLCGLAESTMFTNEEEAQKYLKHAFRSTHPHLRSYLLYCDLLISNLFFDKTESLIKRVKEDFSGTQEIALQFLTQADEHFMHDIKLTLLKLLIQLAKNPNDVEARHRLGKWYNGLSYFYMSIFRKESWRESRGFHQKKFTSLGLSHNTEKLPEKLEDVISLRTRECYKTVESDIDKINNKLDFYDEMARIYFYGAKDDKDFKEALRCYIKVWELGQKTVYVLDKIVFLFEELRQLDKAERYLKIGMQDLPAEEKKYVHISYGLFLLRVDPTRQEEALKHFLNASKFENAMDDTPQIKVAFNKREVEFMPERLKNILGLSSSEIVRVDFNLKYVSLWLIADIYFIMGQKDEAQKIVEQLAKSYRELEEKSQGSFFAEWDDLELGRKILADLYDKIAEQFYTSVKGSVGLVN